MESPKTKQCKQDCDKIGKICNKKTGRCVKQVQIAASVKRSLSGDKLCPVPLSLDDPEFIRMTLETIKAYYTHGERSNAKLKILHGYIACAIKTKMMSIDPTVGSEIKIYALPEQESKVSGAFYDKYVDITIKHNRVVIGMRWTDVAGW